MGAKDTIDGSIDIQEGYLGSQSLECPPATNCYKVNHRNLKPLSAVWIRVTIPQNIEQNKLLPYCCKIGEIPWNFSQFHPKTFVIVKCNACHFNLHDVITYLSVEIHETQQLPLDVHYVNISKQIFWSFLLSTGKYVKILACCNRTYVYRNTDWMIEVRMNHQLKGQGQR